MSTAASGVVNRQGVRTPASGMVPKPFWVVASRRFVPCVSARDVVTVASTKSACVVRHKKEGGGDSATPPSFNSLEMMWL